jgi:hypothetical protein
MTALLLLNFWFPADVNPNLCQLSAVQCYEESREYVLEEVKSAGIDPKLIDKLIQCESNWRQNAVGYNRNGQGIDRGLWQWNSKWHPEISDECAFSPKCSTDIAIKHIKKSGYSAWVCSRKI